MSKKNDRKDNEKRRNNYRAQVLAVESMVLCI